MHVATDLEVFQMLAKNSWNLEIKAEGANLWYNNADANCFELKFPDWPGRAAYFSSRASTLGTGSHDANFQGALLWITYSELGALAAIGWKQLEKMRLAFGETRPLQMARGHFFRSDELLDVKAFLVPCFVFGWDAYLIPFGSSDFFVHVSHDEYWGVVAKTQKAYDALFAELSELNPTESARMRRRFCFADGGPNKD